MKTVKKTINGIEYTAVWKGSKYAREAFDRCKVDGSDRLSNMKLAEIIFSEIIISPVVCPDDFTDFVEFGEVFDFGQSVLFGSYWSKSKAQIKKEVESEWDLWRLVFNDVSTFDYDYVFNVMTPDEINKANFALDTIMEQIKKK